MDQSCMPHQLFGSESTFTYYSVGMCTSWRTVWTALHVLWSVIYVSTGAVQIVTGIFFVISIPMFKLGSNIWAGSWNVLVGIGGGMLACFGRQTSRRQELLLYLTISILAVNTVNAVISEFQFYTNEEFHTVIQDPNLYTLVHYARLMTGVCAAAAIITSFLDSQLTFCAMETADNSRNRKKNAKGSHEQVSDIEYIIPRPKTNTVPKSSKNVYNAYAQSWVFDADAAVTTNHCESPYLKLDDVLESDTNVNISPSKQHIKCETIVTNGSIKGEEALLVTNPVVHIEEASDDSTSNGNRKLCYMKSFSRTPSPNVLSASSSQASLVHSGSAPPIYECLERLTEPSVYRSRLNTAISERDDQECVSPAPCISPGPLDRTPVGGEKVQYASLMMELEAQFMAKKDKNTLPTSPPLSTSESVTVSDKSSRQDSSRCTDPKSSDAEFSKELEAALQLIQDLESPNTIETPSEPCRSSEDRRNVVNGTHPHALAVWRHSDASESEKTLSAVGSLAELTSPMAECLPDLHTFKPGKNTSILLLSSDSQSTSGYSSPTHLISKGHTPTHSNTSSINGSSNDLGKVLACSIMNTKTTAIISLYTPQVPKEIKRKSITVVNITGHADGDVFVKDTSGSDLSGPPVGPIEKETEKNNNHIPSLANHKRQSTELRESNLCESKGSSGSLNRLSLASTAATMWNVKSLLRKKKASALPRLPPELEGAIFKSESLAYLSDVELLARHERNKEIQRQIEQRVQQQLGQIPTESQC